MIYAESTCIICNVPAGEMLRRENVNIYLVVQLLMSEKQDSIMDHMYD